MKIMFRRVLATLIMISGLGSCNSASEGSTSVNPKNVPDLEAIDFTEPLPGLYASHIVVEEGIVYDSARDGQLTDSMLQYRISNTITDAMKLKVPQQELGYLYKSPTIDSLARFRNIWFHKLNTLTNKNKQPIAYYAETEFSDPKTRKALLNEFIQQYGNPVYSFLISREFNQCSYEWQLKDRTIQIETSNGFRVSFGGNDTTANQSKYYSFYMLIIDNRSKQAIHDAHIYEFPEKILYEGKWHSYKDFQFEKKQVFRDDFLLHSSNEKYIKNENGEYDINNAEEE